MPLRQTPMDKRWRTVTFVGMAATALAVATVWWVRDAPGDSLASRPQADPAQAGAPRNKPLPGFVAAAPPIAQASGAAPGSGNEAFRQAVAQKMQALAASR